MNSRQTDANRASECNVDASQNEATLQSTFSRRQFLQSVGGMTVISSVAGCMGDTTQNSNGDSNGDGKTSVDEWLSKTGNYVSIRDLTEKRSVVVKVGAQGNAGSNAFSPAAIKISPATTITWSWVGGYHNVVAKGGEFSSGDPEQNATFKHTFESAGTYLYYCDPHQSMGMKGAVVVERTADETDN